MTTGTSSRPRTVLITGGTGFVGANLARRMIGDGHDVHLVIRSEHAGWRLTGIERQVTLHECTLADPRSVASVVDRVRPSWTFHLAAHGAYPAQTDLAQMVATNYLGTINLLRACAEVPCDAFVHAGSSSEYGYKDHPAHETEWLEPNSHYAATKAAASLFCRCEAQLRDLPVRILRLYSVYGPWEEPTRLIPTLAIEGLEGRLPRLVDPDIARDHVYVEDVVDAFLLSASLPAQRPGSIYNIGSGAQTTIRDVVAAACRLLGISDKPRWGSLPQRAWDTRTWVADVTEARSALGWHARHDLDDGLRRFVEWLRADDAVLDLYRARRGAGSGAA